MDLQTNLKGRLRNTSLPKKHGLMPVFEAVINSIHAIEDAKRGYTPGKVRVTIVRSLQQQLDVGRKAEGEITAFVIEDNGCGFNDENYRSFGTLDSEHKIDRGCRGVGRLMWLKAFNSVQVKSNYRDSRGEYRTRTFIFDENNGVHGEEDAPSDVRKTGTIVRLNVFRESYRKSSPKTQQTIANSLLEHCLWYFVRGEKRPEIDVVDGAEVLLLDSLFDSYMFEESEHDQIELSGQNFELTHIKFRNSTGKKHSIAFCANERLVQEDFKLNKIPGLHSKMSDKNGNFIYSCYISSPFLDEHTRSERTGFDLDEFEDDLFSDTDITIGAIRDAVIKKSKSFLSESLEENLKAGSKRINAYIAEKAPRYRSLLRHMTNDDLLIDPDLSDKELELRLHSRYADIEQSLISEGHEILIVKDDENQEDYQNRISEYLHKAEDLKNSDLANYVVHRKVILDLLERALIIQENGKYAREDLIHQLIMPMGKESKELAGDASNLWLIDDTMAFHDYLASDKPISSMDVSDVDSGKEPDLLMLNTYDRAMLVGGSETAPLAELRVVEIKRPMRNDAKSGEDKDPIEQALGYLERLRSGNLRTAKGRPIQNCENVPGYCYVISDLTSTVETRCKMMNLTKSADGLSYFGYAINYKSYIEVLSFDLLLKRAKERNYAFFEKLGLPAS
ncbi:MAG: ATP-binding protein [Alteromonas sp.]|jgi:hypothetical protein|uniref:ATP-binding protein n=1 Tax=Alteromonas sp. TaxID=232 RepID=UPI000C11B74B|nr:MAG: ATP-binding protein [Oceanobacter sp.]